MKVKILENLTLTDDTEICTYIFWFRLYPVWYVTFIPCLRNHAHEYLYLVNVRPEGKELAMEVSIETSMYKPTKIGQFFIEVNFKKSIFQ